MNTTQTDDQTYIAQLAAALGETEPTPIAQLARFVERCGQRLTQRLLFKTEQIEKSGGQFWEHDKTKRRTKGGVFFHLARKAARGTGHYAYIFPPSDPNYQPSLRPARGSKRSRPQQPARPKVPPPPPLPPVTWEDRAQLVQEATSGAATSVKITLVGRPSKVVERPGFVLVLMKRSGPLSGLPKGIPVPTTSSETDYIVYVGAKQWAKMQEALTVPEDMVIIEGVPILDPKFNAITVFATNPTTKLLQQAQKAGRTKGDTNQISRPGS